MAIAQRVVAEPLERGERPRDDVAQQREPAAEQHRGGRVEQRLDFLVDLDAPHQPVQQPRQEEHFADQRQPRHPIHVRGVVEEGDDRGDGRQHAAIAARTAGCW